MSINRDVKFLQGKAIIENAAFTTTGATVEVSVAPLKRLSHVSITAVGSSGNADMFVDETLGSDGLIAVDDDGEITIKRNTTTVSGQKITIVAFGF
jgi:hypothetical protein